MLTPHDQWRATIRQNVADILNGKTFDHIPPKDLFFTQMVLSKMGRLDKVLEISELAKQRMYTQSLTQSIKPNNQQVRL